MKKVIIIFLILLVWGFFIRPPVAGGRLSSIWGLRFTMDRLFHPGSDIAHVIGTPVHPIAGGTVTDVSYNERHGNFIIISHLPGICSRYLHLDKVHSSNGDKVNHKTVIGTVGNTGISTGPHIHWEIRVFNIPLPAYLICLPGRILQRTGTLNLMDNLLNRSVYNADTL